MRRRKPLIALAALGVLLAVGLLLPYKAWLEARLKSELAAAGFPPVDFHLSSVGLSSVTLSDISMGGQKLESLTLGYSPQEIMQGNFRQLHASNMALEQGDVKIALSEVALDIAPDASRTRWQGPWNVQEIKVSGLPVALPPLMGEGQFTREGRKLYFSGTLKSADGRTHTGFTLDYPLDEGAKIQLKLSELAMALEEGSLSFATLEAAKDDSIGLEATGIRFRQGQDESMLTQATLLLKPLENGKEWKGPWSASGLSVTALPMEVPALSGHGTINAGNAGFGMAGQLANADKQYALRFALDGMQRLNVQSLRLPWNGGALSVAGVEVALQGDKPITFTLHVQKVSLDKLMADATKNKASATGTISGSVPVTLRRDGSFTLHDATLKADGEGMLTLAPELIPGDEERVQLVRQVLQGFNYQVFSMALEEAKDDTLSILLSLQGNNPEVYNGRQINLNVHLTGDVIELLTQSVMMLQNPQQLLRQERHAK